MLSKGRAFLRDVVERQGIPIFGQIELALKSTVRVLKDNIWPQDLTRAEDSVTPVKFGHITLGDKMISMFNLFNSLKNQPANQFTFAELAHAYRTLTNRLLPVEVVRQLARVHLANANSSPSCSNTSSPSLSRSSSSDEPEEDHFEVIGSTVTSASPSSSPASATSSSSSKKLKSRSKKSRKMKKLSDIFPSDSSSSSSEPPLPPLNEIVITFDQFCCIVSELNEKARSMAEQNALHNQNGGRRSFDGGNVNRSTGGALMTLPGKVIEKVGSNLFSAFSIIKTMFSIPVEEQQQSTGNGFNPSPASSHYSGTFSSAGGNSQHPLHPSRLLNRRAPFNSFPSRSSSPNYWSAHSEHHSSLPRFNHVDASPQLHPPHTPLYGSSYSVSSSGSPSPSLAHLRGAPGHQSARSASPSLFRHRHSLSTPSPNHLAPYPLLGGHSPSPLLSRGSSGGEASPAVSLGMHRRAFHSSTSSITSLLYDNYTDLYIGGCLEEAFLNQSIIPLLKYVFC